MKNKIELPEEIKSELEYEKFSFYRRRLRLLKSEFPELQKDYDKVSKLVYNYQQEYWDKPIEDITDEQIKESDEAEALANNKRVIEKWKKDLEHFFVTRWN
jgi:hypothetical protein